MNLRPNRIRATHKMPEEKLKNDGINFSVSFPVVPMGKPRMTQRDKWKKREVVLRYHAFKDQLRLCVNQTHNLRATLESGNVDTLSWTAYLPMAPSWPKKKKAAMAGTLHRAKPDRDNIDKAIMDALFADDSGIASGTIVKRWDDGNGSRIDVQFSSQNVQEHPTEEAKIKL